MLIKEHKISTYVHESKAVPGIQIEASGVKKKLPCDQIIIRGGGGGTLKREGKRTLVFPCFFTVSCHVFVHAFFFSCHSLN